MKKAQKEKLQPQISSVASLRLYTHLRKYAINAPESAILSDTENIKNSRSQSDGTKTDRKFTGLAR